MGGLGFSISIYTSCKPLSWDKKSCKSPTFVTSPDIVKICWPVPVVFPFFLGRVFHVKIPCPLCLIYCSSSFILPIVSNTVARRSSGAPAPGLFMHCSTEPAELEIVASLAPPLFGFFLVHFVPRFPKRLLLQCRYSTRGEEPEPPGAAPNASLKFRFAL